MSYNINTLSDFFHRVSEHIENTTQFINKTNLWLITPNITEVPLVDRPTVIDGIEKIVKYGRIYTNHISVLFETIQFVANWPNVK
jgi:hypothetical protein